MADGSPGGAFDQRGRLIEHPAGSAAVKAMVPMQVLNMRGWRGAVPAGVVYVGRRQLRVGLAAIKWANPFKTGCDGTRAEVIAKYRAWLLLPPALTVTPPELRSKDLVCGCASVLGPVISHYRGIVKRLFIRGGAAFANLEMYEFLEAEDIGYAIRLPANNVLWGQDRLSAEAPGRATAA